MVPTSDTKTKILDRAAELLMKCGYNGFSYRDISAHLGVKNAAIHYHFPSKADLALALVEEYRQILRKSTSEFMAYGGPALPQLEGFFRFSAQQFHQGRCICPFGAFSIDFLELPDEVRDSIKQFLDDSVNWLTQVLEVGREQEEIAFIGDPRQKAMSIFSAVQGARQVARIGGVNILEEVICNARLELGLKSDQLRDQADTA